MHIPLFDFLKSGKLLAQILQLNVKQTIIYLSLQGNTFSSLLQRTFNRTPIMDISGMRHPYHDKNDYFLEDNIEVKEPLDLFHKWFQVVKTDTRTVEPNAMCLSTCTKYVVFCQT
ncbi:unnamed protein product [Acanthoscelides obtectus]|uniref:Uncharacterized protein n=1 Tax=Acanthoscelides obtectus TaxID=200917 RepID=A0A9P0KTM9_ACAOB|nr:unnamed protein product [Acanthoscelides obtectus]CAH2015768.1 unnamed protein product [Acanthoscelides obtectus]CAK1622056.1 hypothetical protein AOBTE_LOCUS1289 [Acanthoscelides obtectus]CAK1622066.1 hypothetical protein AOBTE_LOCUS1293 [Acanthoscelides obtectus]